ncbi:MAG: hypothetical protein K1X53_10555 [Candidatus Sumerlaeaceae bacterium]|nr:hypothetical protein [Candidatus Sumerlaeaceae bacterium]
MENEVQTPAEELTPEKRSRKRRWLWYVLVGIPVVLLLVDVCTAPSRYFGPSTLRVVVDPISLQRTTLAEALVALSKGMDDAGDGVRFRLSSDDAQLSVSLITKGRCSVKTVLDILTQQTNREIHYGTCGTCGGIMGPIYFTPKAQEVWFSYRTTVDVSGDGIKYRESQN